MTLTDATPADAHAVRFANVAKSYDGRTLVIDNLSFEVARGEFLTLLGPSGSGKTTTLMMLAGFETATRGDIFLNGTPVTRLPPHKRGLGFVFQNYALFPHMTVAENLAFPLEVRNVPKAEIGPKVARALKMVELSGFEGRRPAELSGGQQQRVAVARALVFEPSIVLMDEPLGALDKRLREQLQLELRRLHRELGVTIVYVTHDQSEAMTLSDRIAVFNRGRIEQIAAPESLYDAPETAFVAGFVGENNALPGTVGARDGDTISVTLKGGNIVGARGDAGLDPGAAVSVCVRPEKILLGSDAPNPLSCRIEERVFLGDHVRLLLRSAGGFEIMAKVASPESDGVFAPGQDIRIGFKTDDARALAPGE